MENEKHNKYGTRGEVKSTVAEISFKEDTVCRTNILDTLSKLGYEIALDINLNKYYIMREEEAM